MQHGEQHHSDKAACFHSPSAEVVDTLVAAFAAAAALFELNSQSVVHIASEHSVLPADSPDARIWADELLRKGFILWLLPVCRRHCGPRRSRHPIGWSWFSSNEGSMRRSSGTCTTEDARD